MPAGDSIDAPALVGAMIPRGPLVHRQGGLDLAGRGTAQPFHLALPGLLVVKGAHLLPGTVASAEDEMGVLVPLVAFGVGLVDGPHDGHVPAFRELVCQFGDDLNTGRGGEGVRQG